MNTVVQYVIYAAFLLLPVNHAEQCTDYGVYFHRSFVSDGEPVMISCPLHTEAIPFNLTANGYGYNPTWYKRPSGREITEEKPRIHLLHDSLLLSPANNDDSGPYECVLRNSTNCIKKTVILIVYNNEPGMCFNSSVKYPQIAKFTPNGKIVCPDLDKFEESGHLSPVTWYKECSPIPQNVDKFAPHQKALVIKRVTAEDEGNYTCEATFTFDGINHKLTRTIDLDVQALENIMQSQIISPINTTLEVERGEELVVNCEVMLGLDSPLVYWSADNKYIEDIYENKRVVENETQEISVNGSRILKTPLIFSEVKSEDYGIVFECTLHANSRRIKAYFILKVPDTWIRNYIIASLAIFTFLLIIGICTYKFFKVDIVLLYRDSCYPIIKPRVSDDKVYDAYIIYPRNNNNISSTTCSVETFVLKCLPEILENIYGYKLFIFGRDALPGEAVVDDVDETIKKSRRLLIVLTAAASTDDQHGHIFEHLLGLYDALIAERVKVILVEFEKLHDYRNFPESIRYIKKKEGVIRWKGDYTEKSLSPKSRFWKNLRYLMPPRYHQMSHGECVISAA